MTFFKQIVDAGIDWITISVDGTYDDANRIAAQIGDSKGIGVVNINMRSHYVEGSKTFSYEVVDLLNSKKIYLSFLYIILSLVLSVSAAYIGILISKFWLKLLL